MHLHRRSQGIAKPASVRVPRGNEPAVASVTKQVTHQKDVANNSSLFQEKKECNIICVLGHMKYSLCHTAHNVGTNMVQTCLQAQYWHPGVTTCQIIFYLSALRVTYS